MLLFPSRSRYGLSASSSSMTYPPIVPSENVTRSPSSPSNSTASSLIPSRMRARIQPEGTAGCAKLLTKRNLQLFETVFVGCGKITAYTECMVRRRAASEE
jgi:hypothetical protein